MTDHDCNPRTSFKVKCTTTFTVLSKRVSSVDIYQSKFKHSCSTILNTQKYDTMKKTLKLSLGRSLLLFQIFEIS